MTTENGRWRRRHWLHPLAVIRSALIRPKVLAGALTAAVTLAVLPEGFDAALRSAIAWVAGGTVYLAIAGYVMGSSSAERVRVRAAVQDDSAVVILGLILVAIAASFLAIVGLLSEAKAMAGLDKLAVLGLAAATIFVSWSVTQVAFALHYAHEFYAPPERQAEAMGGLEFPGGAAPDYWDFLYFSTGIGAASQTSDVSIRSKVMRRLVTLHSIVSFFFNTMVLALSINLASGLI